MGRVLRRLREPLPGEGDPTLFAQQALKQTTETNQDLRILRRIGSRPSHRSCGCPLSWLQIVRPVIDRANNENDLFRDGALGFAIGFDKEMASSTNQEWQQDIRDLGGGGGIAEYEKLVISDRRAFNKSSNWAIWQAGIRYTPNPFPEGSTLAMQEPIPGLESPPLPLPIHQTREPEWVKIGGPAPETKSTT